MDHDDPGRLAFEGRAGIFDVQTLLRVIYRRFPIVLITACLVLTAAGLFVAFSPRVYTATASILLDSRKERFTQSQSVLSELPANSDVADTETELLHSRPLAEQVVTSLGLDKDPEFVGRNGAPGRPAAIGIGLATEAVLQHASVSRVGLTYLMNLNLRSRDPAKAARIANAWARAYVEAKTMESLDANGRAVVLLRTRLDELRDRMLADDAALQTFKVHKNLLSSGSANSLNEQEASTYNDNFAEAQKEVAEAAARLKAAREQVARGSNGEDVGETLSSPVIQNLRVKLAEEGANVAALRSRYGPQHPALQQAQQELSDTSTQLQAEVKRIISSLEARLSAAQQSAAAIQASRAGAQSALVSDNQALVERHGLETAAQTSASVYSEFLSRYKETVSQQGMAASDVRIASPAEPPLHPSFPQPKIILGAGLALAAASAFGAALLAEALDDGLANRADVERLLGLRSLGGIARLRTLSPNVSQSVRAITRSLLWTQAAAPVRIIAVLSAHRSEGRTTTAHLIAQAAAMEGVPTVLLDYAARSGGAERLDTPPQYAVVPLADLAHLGSLADVEAFARAISAHFERCRLVIIDGPSVFAEADALGLARIADRVVLVARWRKTGREQVSLAARLIHEAGGRIAGVVLSMVNQGAMKRFAGPEGWLYVEASKAAPPAGI